VSAAEELRAAATKLRETAVSPLECIDPIAEGELDEWTKYYGRDCKDLPVGDAPWITLMTPKLAEPLAMWLEGVADGLTGFDEERDGCECTAEDSFHYAVRVACVINGGAR
jgi:hypothetical protein